jgi:hypothetical protein
MASAPRRLPHTTSPLEGADLPPMNKQKSQGITSRDIVVVQCLLAERRAQRRSRMPPRMRSTGGAGARRPVCRTRLPATERTIGTMSTVGSASVIRMRRSFRLRRSCAHCSVEAPELVRVIGPLKMSDGGWVLHAQSSRAEDADFRFSNWALYSSSACSLPGRKNCESLSCGH